jgi:tetratricopeptide (TPR) repeat protein
MLPDSELNDAFEAYCAGRLDRAAALYQQVLHRNPHHVCALHNLGIICAEQGRMREAEHFLAGALSLEPGSPDILNAYGNVLSALGDTDRAIRCFEDAAHSGPMFAHALINKGALLHRLGRFEEAIASYDQLLSSQPHNPVCLGNRALSLQALGRSDLALADFNLAAELAPGDAESFVNRANLLQELSRFEEALADYERALAINAVHLTGLTGKGQALGAMGNFAMALAALDRAIQIYPDHPDAHFYRGNVFRDQKKFAEAIANYDKALAIRPDFVRAQRNKGLVLLLDGDFGEGLRLYEYRKKLDPPIDARSYDAPLWTGREPIQGKTVFVYIEQGLGDTIQFYRFVGPLAERGAKVILSAQDGLRELLANGEPRVDVIASTQVPGAFDFHIPLASVPLALEMNLDTVPAVAPYLRADAGLKEFWRHRLGNHGFKIGIAWQGGTILDKARSFPLLMFQEIAQLEGIRLISLQKGHGSEQLNQLPPGMAVECFDGLDGAGAFTDTAAIMAGLDLVVTPDTSLAHLAGALARPVCVMLKQVPDWRWLLDRDDSPWYPTMRLFRQQHFGDWNSAFALLHAYLRQNLSRNPGPL